MHKDRPEPAAVADPRGSEPARAGADVDEATDALRRTLLANERTYLAWWRTGLTAVAVSLALGKVVPELTGAPDWPYVAVGAAYGLLGVVFIVYGFRRQAAVGRALDHGEYARPDGRLLFGLTAVGALFALVAVVAVIASG